MRETHTNAVARATLDLEAIGEGLAGAEVNEVGSIAATQRIVSVIIYVHASWASSISR